MRRLLLAALLALPITVSSQQAVPSQWEAARQQQRGEATAQRRNDAAVIRVSAPTGQATAEADPWFGPDKARHFFVSAALQSLSYGALRAAEVEHGTALGGASAVTAAFGIGKELRDRRQGRRISVRDLVWDAAGAAAVSVLLARTER